jgi:hypothetical protein
MAYGENCVGTRLTNSRAREILPGLPCVR